MQINYLFQVYVTIYTIYEPETYITGNCVSTLCATPIRPHMCTVCVLTINNQLSTANQPTTINNSNNVTHNYDSAKCCLFCILRISFWIWPKVCVLYVLYF